MKLKHLGIVLVMVCLASFSCVTSSETDDNNDSNPPNFVSDPCAGCKAEENIGNVTGIRFFSYVKNTGGSGKISMTIGAGDKNASKEFNVTAGTSYVFQASVPVEKSSTTTFTYQAKFPGSSGYTDTHAVSGYHVTGAPFDLQMNPK
ncbi:MAG: hypothetical protein L6428_12585 [Candidatus Aminicenantes bacterium]|nr:hypothetical protein [Acidobacteriota bacterium]MCG2812270.1 hypothetical protein [Candidatus Aminicenantes bacterium]